MSDEKPENREPSEMLEQSGGGEPQAAASRREGSTGVDSPRTDSRSADSHSADARRADATGVETETVDPHTVDPERVDADRADADRADAEPARRGASPLHRAGESLAGPTERTRADLVRSILTGSAMTSILSVIVALIVGAILIGASDPTVQQTAGYFFSRPSDFFQAFFRSVGGAYSSLFQGAIYNFRRPGFAAGIKPLMDTLYYATPLITAGLGVALGFRTGLFNIGGRGQMIIGGALAGWLGINLSLPTPIHLLVVIAGGVVGGAIWGGIVGVLKARTGAHEVIVTIMLNYVAFYLLNFLLNTKVLQAPGQSNPISAPLKETAVLPPLFGQMYSVNLGFVIAIIAVIICWLILDKSSLGFRMRAVGENPAAARTAGMNVKTLFTTALILSGALVGVSGAMQVQGPLSSGFGGDIDSGIGFDAITVALLGRSKPWGVFGAGLLFGAFRAGGYAMQAANQVPIDIVLIVESIIVLFIAAPPLVRTITGMQFFVSLTKRDRKEKAA